MKYKILVAEDDNDIVKILKLYLDNSGFEVVYVDNGMDALKKIQEEHIDLAILDLIMPIMNGYELTKNIREISNIPILIFSAKYEISDKILALSIGADDYLTKPFEPMEVIARINSNLRRCYELDDRFKNQDKNFKLQVGELNLDLDNFTIEKNGLPINVTATEYKILAKLMKYPGRVYSKAQLYESINGEYCDSDDSTMMVHISNLREKIEEDPKNPKYIKTVRGIGYKIEVKK
ncbi:response regulator transcription factor [Clostridium butyricum]|uniref:response regulator transcription factor n=1 Tax=Clostridium butyricum TaxID=1492 RepID=UPI000DE87966|nr:response regulator transcription factor [Clostridium butyricum]AXB86983.1 DNA-binding response regulator [Clostridium butyricum]MDB2159320.1 response regulator transcription factor [Clostridium butyricum]QGH20542.1 DNA-binding response regulator [Clostridium butyricum]QGH24583.1 DNA-binding response regulator [Clostridium butyricum]